MKKDRAAVSEIVNKLVVSKLYATTAINDLELLMNKARGDSFALAYATCCMILDDGKDPRESDLKEVVRKAKKDLSEE